MKEEVAAAKLEKTTLPATVAEMVDSVAATAYPNIAIILQLLLVLPVTTATVERATHLSNSSKPAFVEQ